MPFDYTLDFDKTDFRKNPEFYKVWVGEQGVLLVEPYKSEILPHWIFKTPEIAEVSATKIYSLSESYLKGEDFVGADMARKFLQIGFTRSRRYTNHSSGKKYYKAESLESQKIQKEKTKNLDYPYSSGSSNKKIQLLNRKKNGNYDFIILVPQRLKNYQKILTKILHRICLRNLKFRIFKKI